MSIAVFDIGGTYIKYAEISENDIILQGQVPTPKDSQDEFLNKIKLILLKMSHHVQGIALSIPGVVDVDKKFIFAGGSLTYNNKTDVKQWEKYFSLPIELENDARCAAIAELNAGNMRGIDKGIVLTFGTGIGGGIIIDGKIYKGSHLISGEVSVILTKDIREFKGQSAWGARCSSVNLIKKIAEEKNIDSDDGKKVFQFVEEGDEKSVHIFEEYCYEVVSELHNLQCILDPQRICIGGGISSNTVFIEGIKKAQNTFYKNFPVAFPRAEIMKCYFENDANLRGAYHHYLEKRG